MNSGSNCTMHKGDVAIERDCILAVHAVVAITMIGHAIDEGTRSYSVRPLPPSHKKDEQLRGAPPVLYSGPWHVDVFCAISTEQNEISMFSLCCAFAKFCARARAPFETWDECELFARGVFVCANHVAVELAGSAAHSLQSCRLLLRRSHASAD